MPELNSDNLLTVNNLTVVSQSSGRLLDRVSFTVRKRQTFSLLGESGAGKSLVALSVLRLLPPGLRYESGEIFLKDKNLLSLPEFAMKEVRGAKIAMIFQEPSVAFNPVMTVGQQIDEVLRFHHGLRKTAARNCACEWLAKMELQHPAQVYRSYPHQLSGGMKQRAMIAMALACDPDLLIADEPTTALDVTIQAQILELLRSIQSERGISVLFISHDLSVVSNIADRMAVMRKGRILDEMSTGEFFAGNRHPYSRQLLSVIPSLDKRAHLLLGGERRKEVSVEKSVNSKLLDIQDLKVHFPVSAGLFNRSKHSVKAVDGVSLRLQKGKTLAVVGESGSGKSTLAKAILKLLLATSGKIFFDGQDIQSQSVSAEKAFRRRVQAVFQDPYSSMNPRMTIGEMVKEGMQIYFKEMSTHEMDDKICHLLQEVGIDPGCRDHYPHEFSGGQRQRICIARALAVEPELIVCDEPTSALDLTVQAQILDLLTGLQERLGLSYFFITHDMAVVSYLAHEVAVMFQGRIVECEETTALFAEPGTSYTKNLLAAVPLLKTG